MLPGRVEKRGEKRKMRYDGSDNVEEERRKTFMQDKSEVKKEKQG